MIELGTRPTVVIQAAPFCFGPASTSLAIAAELRKYDIAIVWLAEGTTAELLSHEATSDYVVRFSLDNDNDRLRLAYLVEEADAVLVNTDPEFAAFAICLNPRTLYVDILYWMWDALPDVVHRCHRYIFEDFLLNKEQQQRIGLPKNALRIGPLIRLEELERDSSKVGDHLLVSLGGLHRPNGTSRELLLQYEDMVRDAVIAALPRERTFKTVYFAGGVRAEERWVGDRVRWKSGCLSRATYLELLASAKAAILAPGLTGFYEATSVGTPTYYLPPHNYSQYLQLEIFKQVIAENSYSDWRKLGLRTSLQSHLPEAEMLVLVDMVLRELVTRGDCLHQQLRSFVGQGWSTFDAGAAKKLLAVDAFADGGGPARVASEIVETIAHKSLVKRARGTRTSVDDVPLPRKITLDVSGSCQLRCPLCPTGARVKTSRPSGMLSLSDARKIMDQVGDQVETVELFSWGEPFLNPHCCGIIKHISDRGIRTVVSSNLQKIPDPRAIVDSGLAELIVSCHGVTQGVYEKYMVGGRVANTFRNLDSILEARREGPSPDIVIRYVVFSHNEHELPLMRERFAGRRVRVEAAPMRVDMRNEILRTTARNVDSNRGWIPASSRFYDVDQGYAKRAPVGCNLPFEEVVINADGSVSLCASSYDGRYDVGNVLTDGFREVWNGSKYQAARRIVSGRAESGDEAICRICKNNGYRDF